MRKDGTRFNVLIEITLIRGQWGDPVSCVIYARDITERKAAEARLREMKDEIAHRLQNLLRVVRYMASQTVRSSAGLAEFEKRFAQRVEALGRSHDLLVEAPRDGVALADLVEVHVRPFLDRDGGRLDVRGSALMLKPRIAQDLGFVLHELATNAARHGALMSETGRVAVEWDIDPETDEFRLAWLECGGPRVLPPQRKGFGHKVISEIIAHHGKVELEFRPEGLAWTFAAPASSVVQAPSG
jgi:two-component sensor histidine kinase